MNRYLLIILLFTIINSGYSQDYKKNEYVSLELDGKLKKTEHVLSDVILIVPKGTTVQILKKASTGVYKIKYRDYIGFMNELYFSKKSNSKNIDNDNKITNTFPKTYKNKVSLKMDGKLKKTEHVLSDVILVVPKGSTVQVLKKSRVGVYKVKYRNYIGFMNDLYFSDEDNFDKIEDIMTNNMPPILTITYIDFSEKILDGGEIAKLKINIKNLGPGDAKNVYVNLSGNLQELIFPETSYFPTIKANGGNETITINLKGSLDLPSSEALVKIEVVEPNFKVKIQGKQLKFLTREFRKPKLILAKYAIIENQSANPNNQVDINEMVDLKFAVQNIGQGNAENVNIKIENNQNGVMFLGVVKGNQLIRQNPNFSELHTGKYETIIYSYFINSEFTDNQLEFTLTTTEQVGKYGFSETKTFSINRELEEVGYIRNIAMEDDNVQGDVIIEDIPDFVVDVDTDIPVSAIQQTHTYALIIGNEDYKARQKGLRSEQNVDFAENDAQVFSIYCEKTLGIPKKQIKLLKNATSAEINRGLSWISNLSKIENGNAKLIFYYSGHGLPDEHTKEAYIIPVDVSGTNLEYAIKVKDIYNKLTEHPSRQVTVFLDACFSGGARNQELIALKGVRIKPKANYVSGNLIIFSSSSGSESSSVYREKHHGYFTYYLLKKLKDTKGQVNYDNLSNYIIQSVSKETGLNGILQTPQVNVSHQMEKDWETLRLK